MNAPTTAVLLACMCLACAGRARAAARTPSEVDARYAAIESALARDAPAARLWWTGWVTGYAALGVGQAAFALAVHDKGLRVDAAVGASTSLVALGGTLLGPRTPFTAPGELARMDASTPRARRLRLERAEQLLRDAAESERAGLSPWMQLGGAAVTLGSTFVLWIGYHRYLSGWLNLLASTAVGELQFATQPTDAIATWNAYRAGRLVHAAAAEPRLSWSVALAPGGVWLSGRF